ncbi:MAG: S9 family peptidase [Planctomycetia bacterium]|nr:S9 family peptidase [Planctomycetia bacterium]
MRTRFHSLLTVLATAALITSLAAFLPTAAAETKTRPITVEDLFKFKRVSDPQLSPDGKLVVYVVTTVDLAANSTSSTLWLAPTDAGAARQLTNTTKKDRHPRWSPDGRRILFESNRTGETQLWTIELAGGEAKQLTTIATEAATGIWSRDGRWIAFVSAVYPEFSAKAYAESDAANRRRADEAAKNPVKARTFTRLFYRHWDSWVEDKRQHLFVMPAEGGEPRDVTPGDRDGYPTSSTFSLGDDFTFSPDGRYLVYTAPPERDEAWSTNYDIWRVPIAGGTPENLTAANQAADSCPRFSPDGKLLAYRAQKVAGFEADQWELVIAEAAGESAARKPRVLTGELDSSVDQFLWTADGASLLFVAEERAAAPIFRVGVADAKVATFLKGHTHAALSRSDDGRLLACTEASMRQPAEVMVVDRSAQATNVSRVNAMLLADLDLPKPESVDVPGAGGTPMQMWILKPSGFDPAKKWPLVYLVHGGPQGAWEDAWSFRWNPQVWAAQGYVIALPNPRGSTGFGQKYTGEISGDWGGKVYEDLMAGVDYLEKLPYIDRDRIAAAGASFGGYMINWFAGHTDRFKALVTHCGVYNFDSMYATTDELWFDEFEHGGAPWVNRESYEKFSPHRFAQNFKTPMLVIHNDLDFRVPISEGHQLFTTLKRLRVPSRMINFPDEGHWVLKPANSLFWHKEIFAFLREYVPPGPK